MLFLGLHVLHTHFVNAKIVIIIGLGNPIQIHGVYIASTDSQKVQISLNIIFFKRVYDKPFRKGCLFYNRLFRFQRFTYQRYQRITNRTDDVCLVTKYIQQSSFKIIKCQQCNYYWTWFTKDEDNVTCFCRHCLRSI